MNFISDYLIRNYLEPISTDIESLKAIRNQVPEDELKEFKTDFEAAFMSLLIKHPTIFENKVENGVNILHYISEKIEIPVSKQDLLNKYQELLIKKNELESGQLSKTTNCKKNERTKRGTRRGKEKDRGIAQKREAREI